MILENIRQLYPSLTKSQRRLADYIASSYQEAAFMTASRLAHRLAVNEATVIRFAQRLGYPGYPELIEEIQMVVKQELKTRDDAPEAIADEEPFVKAMGAEIESVQRAMSHVSSEVACTAQALLQSAGRVLVMGQGVSAPLAQMFCISLRSLGISAECPPSDAASLAIALDGVGNADAVVGVAAQEDGQEVAKALRLAAESGASTLALAWSPVSPVAQAAETAITCPASEQFVVTSVAALAAVMDALVQCLAAQQREVSRARSERHDETREYLASLRS